MLVFGSSNDGILSRYVLSGERRSSHREQNRAVLRCRVVVSETIDSWINPREKWFRVGVQDRSADSPTGREFGHLFCVK